MHPQPKKVIFLASIICGLLLMALGFPLINQEIVLHNYYQIAMKHYNSPLLWNRLNENGGYALIFSALLLLLSSFLLYKFGGRMSTFRYILIFAIILMMCISLATSYTLYYNKDGMGIF